MRHVACLDQSPGGQVCGAEEEIREPKGAMHIGH